MARIELEIDIIASKLFEQWKQIEEAANMLNDFIAVDWKPREAALSPYDYASHISFPRKDIHIVVANQRFFAELFSKVPVVNGHATVKISQSVETKSFHPSKRLEKPLQNYCNPINVALEMRRLNQYPDDYSNTEYLFSSFPVRRDTSIVVSDHRNIGSHYL
ncbi:hypothetical protein DINM_006434 [Dirofilaria immitis]|nr:hypothetical protein [Dirofilaria immitis]